LQIAKGRQEGQSTIPSQLNETFQNSSIMQTPAKQIPAEHLAAAAPLLQPQILELTQFQDV
jgi:hypothetical protein